MNNTEILLRRMQLQDVHEVYEIEKASQIAPWSEGIFRDCIEAGYHAWVIEHEHIIQGYILDYMRADECHILNVCVKPLSQNKGHGRFLMEHVLKDARGKKIKTVLLEVRPSNKAAIHLYRQLGFNEVGVRKDYYSTANGGREDALMFALQL